VGKPQNREIHKKEREDGEGIATKRREESQKAEKLKNAGCSGPEGNR
jgi:hypothetical protein